MIGAEERKCLHCFKGEPENSSFCEEVWNSSAPTYACSPRLNQHPGQIYTNHHQPTFCGFASFSSLSGLQNRHILSPQQFKRLMHEIIGLCGRQLRARKLVPCTRQMRPSQTHVMSNAQCDAKTTVLCPGGKPLGTMQSSKCTKCCKDLHM